MNEIKDALRCSKCGVPVGKNNKSGLCKDCHPRKSREYWRRKQKNQYDYNYVSYEKQSRKKTAKIGKCKMPGCGKEFRLERWQNSVLHWCPKCRKSSDYQDYASYEQRASRYGVK